MPFWTPVVDPRARRRRSWAFDGLVVLAATLAALPEAFAYQPSPVPVASVFVLMLGPLMVRRVWPAPVFFWCLLVAAAAGWWVLPSMPVPALLVALYTVAASLPHRVAFAAASVLGAGVVAASVHTNGGAWWAPTATLAAFELAAVGIGLYVGARRALLAELRDRAARLERERDQQGALAAAAERARITREMHDIVAHHLTVMVALSDGAAAASARSPERAAEAMRTVSATGRQALADTRRLLGVLREDDGAGRGPLPGLGDLDELFAGVRSAGLPVRYEVRGSSPEIPAGAQLTLYRLVQEALTNTIKHAGPQASATVRLHLGPDEVRVEVQDDGVGRGAPQPLSVGAAVARTPPLSADERQPLSAAAVAQPSSAAAAGTQPSGAAAAGTQPSGAAAAGTQPSGRGLVGMGERVAAFGGVVQAGPTDTRGWRVSARLPLDEEARQ